MVWWTFAIGLMLQVTGPATQETAQPAEPDYFDGPLAIELVAMRETRLHVADPEMAARMQSDLRMHFRVKGADLRRLVHFGDLVITEIVDDKGADLLDPESQQMLDPERTRPVNFPIDRLRPTGLLLGTRHKQATRTAERLARVRGSVHLAFADQTEPLTILNPVQYHGRLIDDARLIAMGIGIEMISMEEVESGLPADRVILLRFKSKPAHVHQVSFCDGWLRPMNARPTWLKDKHGGDVQAFQFDAGALTEDLQMVLDVHSEVDLVVLPLALDDVELP